MNNLDLSIIIKLADKASRPLKAFMRTTEQSDEALDRLIDSIEEFDRALNNNRGLSGYSKQLRQIRTEATLTQQSFSTLGAGFKVAWDGIDYAQSKVEKFQQTLANSRAQMRQEMKSMAIGTGMASLGLYQLLKPAIDFEKQMSDVQSVLDLEKNSPAMQQLSKSARKWGAASSFSPSEAAQAQYALGSGGFTDDQINQSLGGTLQLAEAGKVGLERAAQIAVGSLNGFGLAAKEINRVNDVYLKGTNLTATSVDGLGETMKYVAPIAKAYGASLEQSVAMTGLLGNSNILDTQAGTSLRAIMTRFAAPPKQAYLALQGLGIKTNDVNGNLRDMSDIFQEINEKTKNIGSAERLEIFKNIAGQEAVSAFSVLVDQSAVFDENTGKTVNNIKKLTDELENSKGAAARAAAILKDNLAGDIEQLGGSLQDLSISMLSALGTDLRAAVQGLTAFIDKIKEWVEANPKLVKRIADVLLKLLMLKVAVLGMRYSFNLFLGGLVSIFAGITKLGIMLFVTNAIMNKFGIGFWGRMGLLSKGFGMVARGARLLAVKSLPMVLTGLRMLGASLLTNPLFLIGTAIILIASQVIKYWKPITAFFSGFASGLMQGLSPALDRFKQIWVGLKPVLAPLLPIWNGIVSILGFLKYLIVSLFTPLNSTKAELDSLSQSGQSFGFILGTLVGFIADFVGIILSKAIGAIVWLGTTLGQIAGFIVVTFSKVPTFFSDMWQKIKTFFNSGIVNITATILSWSPLALFTKVLSSVLGYFGIELPEKFKSFGRLMIDGLKNGITSQINSLKSTFTGIMSNLPSWAQKILDIRSPSRVFEQIGNFTMQGLANGIESTSRQPLLATANAVQAIPNATAVKPVQPIQKSRSVTVISQDKVDYHISVQGETPIKQLIAELDRREQEKQQIMQRRFKSYRDQE